MPHSKILTIDFEWQPKLIKKNEIVEYKLFVTKKGLILKKIIKKRFNRNDKKHRKQHKVPVKVYKNIKRKEKVIIKPEKRTDIIIKKKNINPNPCTEVDIMKQMENLSIEGEPSYNFRKRKAEEEEKLNFTTGKKPKLN